MRNAYNILVGKPAGKRQLGRPRRRREEGMVWTGFILLRIESTGGSL